MKTRFTLLAALGCGAALGIGCARGNPEFDPGAEDTSTKTTGHATSTSRGDGEPGSTSIASAEEGGATVGDSTVATSAGDCSGEPNTSGTDTGRPTPTTHTTRADLTACVHPPVPNPDECELVTDPGFFQIDANEPDLGGVVNGYLRFSVPAVDGAVLSAVLRATAHPLDVGSSIGAVWQVAPFTYESLFVEVPAPVGAAPLAPAAATVDATLVVEWSLPPTAVSPGTPLYLGIFTEAADGVDYMDADSESPPELIITVQ